MATLRIGHYILGDTLGVGTFGKVKIAEHQYTKHKVAVKILNRRKIRSLDVAGKIKREIQNMRLFCHPHIIKLYQVISTPTDIFMVMEYVSGGELFDYIISHGKLEEDDARAFFQQIISGVDYCHRHMIVHRDLKPENLLLDDHGHVKIADFGLSNMMTDGEFLKTSCGSPNYAAPEVISGKLYAGPEVDVWSCGVILFALLCGALPFDDENVQMLFRKIKGGHFCIPLHVSADAAELLNQMLQVDPVKRISISGIKAHPWFLVNLAEYLFPPDHSDETPAINDSAVDEVCAIFGLEVEEVHSALHSGNPHDPSSIAYHLIVDNKRMVSHEHHISLKPDVIMPSSPAPSYSFMEMDRSLKGSPSLSRSLSPRLQPKPLPPGASGSGLPHIVNRNARKSRWHLGIRSQSSPEDIMAEIFRAMKMLEFEWKIVNPYCIRCRRQNKVTSNYVKMNLQLYKLGTQSYLVDFKNLAAGSPSVIDDFGSDLTPDARHSTSTSCSSSMSDLAEKIPKLDLDDDMDMEKEVAIPTKSKSKRHEEKYLRDSHQNMEFFEMCSALITTLAQ